MKNRLLNIRKWKWLPLLAALPIAMLLAVILPTANNGNKEIRDEHEQTESPYHDADLQVEIIPSPNHTFGYNILMNERTIVHQPNIPALPGEEGFQSSEDALKAAEFVIEKIRKNIFPPSVTIEELDSLGVL